MIENSPPASPNSESERLLAIYDFQANPANFDFFNFLICAEMERVARGLGGLQILFVPGEPNYFFGSFGFDENQKHWRVQNIILPGCSLMPSCRQMSLAADRAAAADIIAQSPNIFPPRATLEQPVDFYSDAEVAVAMAKGRQLATLKAPPEALNFMSQWLDCRAGDREVVTITLRQASYEQDRNSNVEAWCEFARALDDEHYFPVFIPDTEAVFSVPDERLTGLCVFDAPAVNLLLRAALYELSYLNLMIGGGPTVICKYNHVVRYLHFIESRPYSMDTSAANLQGALGLSLGGQFPFLKPYQKFIWRPDSRDAIGEEFKRFVDFDRGLIEEDDYLPAEVESPLVIADRMAKHARNAQAREIYEYMLTGDPDNQELKLKIGAQENMLGHPERALKWLQPLEDSSLPLAILDENLGDAYAGLNQVEDAIDAYENAASREIDAETLVRTAIKLGWLLVDQGQMERAVEKVESALNSVSNGVLLLRFLGEIAASSEQFERALGYYRREQQACELIVAAEPENLELILRIGRLEFLQENYDRALDCFEKLSGGGFNRWDLFEYLGDTKHRLHQVDEAAADYETAIDLSWRRRASPLFKLAAIKFDQGNLDEAITHGLASLDLASDHLPSMMLLGNAYSQNGVIDEAMKYLIMARQHDLSSAN